MNVILRFLFRTPAQPASGQACGSKNGQGEFEFRCFHFCAPLAHQI